MGRLAAENLLTRLQGKPVTKRVIDLPFRLEAGGWRKPAALRPIYGHRRCSYPLIGIEYLTVR
ncbi:MAG: hypothetical protein GYB20_03420 [Oceanospirillales bacterium]|nr:hypothetical protein [Oceanospirillales bacterium]MBR9886742.1 hypothetical protein [Oceanospirillales bacterium]